MSKADPSLSLTARTILALIAQGHTYEQILFTEPELTYYDIFAAAEEALMLDSRAAPAPLSNAAYEARMAEIHARHPRAYELWTDAEDDQLQVLAGEGQSAKAIAAELQRQPSAIQSRIRKLGRLPPVKTAHE